MKKLIISITLFFIAGAICLGQRTRTLDSLSNLLKTTLNDSARAGILRDIGVLYVNQGSYPLGIEFVLKSKKIFESIHNDYGVFRCDNQLAVSYSFMGEFENALYILLTTKKGIEDGRIYDNLGMVYMNKNDLPHALSYLQMALEFYQTKSINKKPIARLLNDIGTIKEMQGETKNAIDYYRNSLEIAEQEKDEQAIAGAYCSLSDVYYKLKLYPIALDYANKNLELAREIGDLIYMRDIEQILASIHASLDNPAEALKHYRQYVLIKDSLVNKEAISQLVRLEENLKYEKTKEVAKIEQEKLDAVQKEKFSSQKRQINIFIGAFAIVLCLSIFLFLIFKKTKKQKIEIEKQKSLIEESRKEVMDNIQYAKRIQDAVTTNPSFIKELIPSSFIYNAPRDVVSGDFLFSEKVGEEIIIAVADCTSHSVSGAFLTILNHNLLGDAIVNGNYSPSDILNYVNTAISKKFHQTEEYNTKKDSDIVKDGMDLIIIKLNLNTMVYEFSGAYNPLLIVRKKELIEVRADKLQLGQTKEKYKNNDGKLEIGDMLFLSSDGYADQFSSNGKKFMKKKMKELLVSISEKPIEEQKSILEQTHLDWKDGFEQTDDILVMGIKI